MTADVSILSGGCRREHDAIWARALEEELLAFTPKHTYVACSRLLTRLRSMRRLLPISIDACVLVPYWCAIWEVVVSNLRSHEADRPETLHIRDSNLLYVWAERTSERVYAALDTYSGSFTGWGLPLNWPTGSHRSIHERVAFVPNALRKMCMWPKCTE